jgi:hypothetical protein
MNGNQNDERAGRSPAPSIGVSKADCVARRVEVVEMKGQPQEDN